MRDVDRLPPPLSLSELESYNEVRLAAPADLRQKSFRARGDRHRSRAGGHSEFELIESSGEKNVPTIEDSGSGSSLHLDLLEVDHSSDLPIHRPGARINVRLPTVGLGHVAFTDGRRIRHCVRVLGVYRVAAEVGHRETPRKHGDATRTCRRHRRVQWVRASLSFPCKRQKPRTQNAAERLRPRSSNKCQNIKG